MASRHSRLRLRARDTDGATVTAVPPLRRLAVIGIALTLLAMLFIAAFGEPYGRIFWRLLVLQDGPAGWMLLLLLLVAVVSPAGGADEARRWLLALDRHYLVVAAVVWLVLAAGTLLVYRGHPLSMDEYAAVFQAKVFAGGALAGRFPAELLDYLIPRQFQNHFLLVNRTTGAVLSAYWPGYSLALAPFALVGAPWACNPTIVAASVVLIRRVTRDLVGGDTAPGWAMLFALASPAFLLNGLAFYSMPLHLLANLGFVWLLIIPTRARLFLAGLVGGFALTLHNPFPHLLFAIPWLVWVTFRHRDEAHAARQRLGDIVTIGIGYLLLSLPLGLGWMLWLQHVLRIGTQSLGQSAGAADAALAEQGLRFAYGLMQNFRLPDAEVLAARIGGLAKLWLWAAPLLLVFAWIGAGRSSPAPLRLCAGSVVMTLVGYLAIPFDQGHGWGYRYAHATWGTLPVLAAAALANEESHGKRFDRAGLFRMLLLALVLANAFRTVQVGLFVHQHLAQRSPTVLGPRVVVLSGIGYYAHDLVQNDPWLRGDEIVVVCDDACTASALMARHFPGEYAAHRNSYGITFQRLH